MTATTRPQLQREWLLYAEAQTVSGLGRTTLYELVRSGEIQAAKVGKATRLNYSSLNEFTQRHSQAYDTN
jgi:excisionase family DNA binding protein